MTILLSLTNESKSGKALTGYINKAKQLRLSYKPFAGLIITSRKDFMNNIMIPLEEYDSFLKSLKKVHKAILLDDMFVYDQDSHLVLNKTLAKEHIASHVSYGKTITIEPEVVVVDNEEYEGVVFIINRAVRLELTHHELKKLRKHLKRIDISSYSMLSAILGYVAPKDELSYSNSFNGVKPENDSHAKMKPDANKSVLTDGLKGRGGKIWGD